LLKSIYIQRKAGEVNVLADLLDECTAIGQWIYDHKIIKQRFKELQEWFVASEPAQCSLAVHSHYQQRYGALQRLGLTRWWSAVEVLCRFSRWLLAIQGIALVLRPLMTLRISHYGVNGRRPAAEEGHHRRGGEAASDQR
jgi:hypothetical protein